MKVVIFAGGYGTRLSEETNIRPKPMVEIGEKPILWHIMKIYSAYGFNEFVICCGYKGDMIKDFFANYLLLQSDFTVDLAANDIQVHKNAIDPWKVTLVDTGVNTMTGGRLKRVRQYLNEEPFLLTYGDGVSNVDIHNLIEFHQQQSTIATLTAVQPPGRFGAFMLDEDEDIISNFREKPKGDNAWINGGFFVVEPQIFDYIESDATVWEQEPLQRLSAEGRLSAYRHTGFWQSMDTLADKRKLENLWLTENPPWKVW